MNTWELHAKPGFQALTKVARAREPLPPGSVRVRVRAVSLNYRDLLIAKGSASRTEPRVPVSDGAGEVLEVGADVTRFQVGDRVMANFFPHWNNGELSDHDHATALGGGGDGMLRHEVVLPASSWVKMPVGWSFEEAATLPCAGLTAWQALFESGEPLRPGDTVLVQGTGGVSIFALQLAHAAGVRVIATTSRPGKQERLTALGAATVLDYRKDLTWGETAHQWAGNGVDRVIDVGGPQTFDESLRALRYGGTLALVGVLTGFRGDVNLVGIVQKRLAVHGIYVGHVEMFERFVRALEATKIRPIVDRVFPFEEAPAAYEMLEKGDHIGKIVIRIDGSGEAGTSSFIDGSGEAGTSSLID